MKKFLFTVAAGVLAMVFTSCGGGWTEESKKSSKETCSSLMEIAYPDDAVTICDCYVNKLVEQHPKADQTQEQAAAIMDECSADAKKKADEAFEKKMNEIMNTVDTTATETIEAVEEAAH